jgi:hypothetical protein
MRRCEDCKIILESDARFCPKCGKSVGAVGDAEPKDARLGVLLTSANLHRVRQEWDAAIADATSALEIDPNNADVASLLASIYEQRGNTDEAAVWYRIALELNPQNPANRARLDRVTRGIGQASMAKRDNRRIWLAAAAAVALVALTVILTLALSRPRPEPSVPSRAASPPTGRTTEIRAPATSPGAASGQAATVRPGAGLPPTGSSLARTPGEAAIKAALAGSEAVRSSGAAVDDVIADPRQGVVVATFTLPATGPVTRAKVITAAGQIAREAFGANPEVRSVTVRCIISPGGPATTQIAFVGDVGRAAMDGLGENTTEAQLDAAFSAKWWNPQIR